MQMPWRTEIIEGLLGADLVGFHLPGGAQNFLILARRLIGANTSRATVGVRSRFGEIQVGLPHRQGRRVSHLDRLRANSTPRPATATSASAPGRSAPNWAIRARSCSASTGWTTPRASTFGCEAFSELLDEGRVDPTDTVLVQLATPSRERVESYMVMREDIERQVGHINGEYGKVGHPIVHYLHQAGAARRADRVLRRRRRHAGDAAARRHEPGRQGVRRLPQRSRRRLGAQRVHRRRSRTPAGLPDQPAPPRRRQGLRSRRRSSRPPRRAGGGCGRCAGRCSPTTSTAGPASFLDALAATQTRTTR